MQKIKRVIAGAVTLVTLLAINPVVAHAEWKSDSTGWWYTEGSSYASGWRLINGNWYYFNSNGYMAHDCWVGSYYLNSSGAWTNSTTNSSITLDQAKKIALDKVKKVKYSNSNTRVIVMQDLDIYEKEIDGRNGYIITIGEDNSQHTVTTARVFVDKSTGEVFDATNAVLGIRDSKLKELS